MTLRFGYWSVLVLWLFGQQLQAAHTSASLLLQAETTKPGATVLAGVRLQMDPGWHTYWKNSGASGMATQIKWELPPGVTAGDILWPIPEKLPEGEFSTYIYKDEVVLLVPLTIASNAQPGALTIKADVSWLECEVMCIPGDAKVQATLAIATEQRPSSHAQTIDRWLKKLPADGKALGAVALYEKQGAEDVRPFILEWTSAGPVEEPDFFPYIGEGYEVLPQTEVLSRAEGKVKLRKSLRKLSGEWPAQIAGVIVQKTGEVRQGYEVNVPLSAGVGQTSVAAASAAVAPLWQMLIYAFIGGLILNIMPCVLPVIALKVLGFVNQARDEPARVRALGIIYTAGVLFSFLILAGLVIGVKAAGHKAGWGMQFGNPQFLVILTTLVTLVALNLFGLFEITPGARVMGAAGSLASKHGPGGAFFHGVLATILATPCTAPFLGVALGFAFAQPAPIIILVFSAVAFGLASPYLVLSWNPAWLRFLPKPGNWMERFKIAMGFPMLATAVWLFSLLSDHYGERTWWLGIFLVLVGFAAWIYGTFVQHGERRRGFAIATVLALLIGAYAFVAENRLGWRSPKPPPSMTLALASTGEGLPWQPWSREAVQAARAEGKPVLVDFTAKWCLTCNTIVKPALESQAVREKMAEIGGVPLLGDYTRFPPEITEELNRYGRAGVPLVLVFPADPEAPAIVLPEALTPGMVVDALNRSVN